MHQQNDNGYPARRRSLVDDARFETLVVKQTKQSVLDEARLRSNDSSVDPEIDADEKQSQKVSENSENDAGLTEEEVVLSNAIAEGPEAEKALQRAALILRLREGMNSLSRVLKSIEKYQGSVCHLETRPNQNDNNQLDALIKVEMTRVSLLQLIRSLRQSSSLGHVTLIGEDNISAKNPWFPRHASELDNCNHLMTKYEPDLDMNHPGFADKEYRARRKDIAEIAFAYKYGDAIPHIEYCETENKTWGSVFNTVLELMPKHACSEYCRVFKLLQEEGIFTAERIPQLEEMSNFLKRHTGFSLRPAAGLLTARDFLASLAFRIFQSTQYVRHKNTPYHTPEPDCIHELLGHMPLLADPSFAQFSQEIGLASLGASDAEIEKLSTKTLQQQMSPVLNATSMSWSSLDTRDRVNISCEILETGFTRDSYTKRVTLQVYWFTVEFGLCKESGVVKAYGAGLLSAYGELLHALSDKPELRPFEPAVTAVQPYQDQEYQPIYYVAESFDDMKDKFRRWVSAMSRPFEKNLNHLFSN
ncbi:hypothetical protein GEV33_013829 [Tenebrio molitor]|uniref:Biopterin-dependent aromatic amino acid hydroxylase family profile domain-containing protein n=1 Tax=Tenebrio molitor TaxID=7067 RepID=A0A8J6H6V3_TENMO|nr:hypothetical protein GEV33_013829 [Tenebrio molitor]